jgi:hypothetical protein
MRMAERYELNDQQWAGIAEMLPGKKPIPAMLLVLNMPLIGM